MNIKALQTHIKDYLNHIKRSEKTIEYKNNMLKHLIKFYNTQEKIKLKFNSKLIDKLVEFLETSKLSQNTIKQVTSEITRFLKYLQHSNIKTSFDSDYFIEIFRNTKKEVKEKDYFTTQELKTISNNITNNDFKLFTNLLFNSGLRLQEALNITKNDIEIENINNKDVIILNVIGKYNKKRQVPLLLIDKIDKESFIEFIEEKENFDFINKKYFQLYLNRLSKKLNIKITAHKFRRTYATYLLEKGLPVEEVSKILGHSDISITLKSYASITDKNRRSKWTNFLNN